MLSRRASPVREGLSFVVPPFEEENLNSRRVGINFYYFRLNPRTFFTFVHKLVYLFTIIICKGVDLLVLLQIYRWFLREVTDVSMMPDHSNSY